MKGNPANTERNKDLVRKRISDPSKWSFGEIAKFYRMDRKTAHEIFERDLHKFADALEIKNYREFMSKK